MNPYYQDDWCTIYHGDCRAILPKLGTFELLLTDPPYGIGFASQPTKWQRLAGHEPESWDDDTPSEEVLSLAISRTEKAVIWGGNYFTLPPKRCWLSWYKPDAPPSMGNVEYAWTSLDQNSRMISHSISATNAERCGHPTQKPLRVIMWALQQAGESASILDPFMGSGTTLRAAKDLQRKSIGIEIDERYCEIAANRLAQEVLAL